MPRPSVASTRRKLSFFVQLTDDDEAALAGIIDDVATLPAGTVLSHETDKNSRGFFIETGWAMRVRSLSNGQCQIVGFMLPGDHCEPGLFVTGRSDQSIETLTTATVTYFQHERWFELFEKSPRLAIALWWSAAHEEALMKEHVVVNGRYGATQRICYIFWELWRRQEMIGLLSGHSYHLPITRRQLADAVGLTERHVYRALRSLEEQKIASFRHGIVYVTDPARLCAVCEGQDVLLQIARPSRAVGRRLGLRV